MRNGKVHRHIQNKRRKIMKTQDKKEGVPNCACGSRHWPKPLVVGNVMFQECPDCGRFASASATVEVDLKEKCDPVNHPKHYTSHPSGIECIQITRHMRFNLGNATKYIWRADLESRSEERCRGGLEESDLVSGRRDQVENGKPRSGDERRVVLYFLGLPFLGVG